MYCFVQDQGLPREQQMDRRADPSPERKSLSINSIEFSGQIPMSRTLNLCWPDVSVHFISGSNALKKTSTLFLCKGSKKAGYTFLFLEDRLGIPWKVPGSRFTNAIFFFEPGPQEPIIRMPLGPNVSFIELLLYSLIYRPHPAGKQGYL
jgi:hypothetical protein